MADGGEAKPPQRYCRNCGANINPSTRFCGVCGSRVAPASPEDPQVIPESVAATQTPPRSNNRTLFLAGAIGVLLLLLAGGAVALVGLGFGAKPATGGFEGYLLRSKEEGAGAGVLFVRYKPTRPAGSITGYMYIAAPAENPEGAYLETQRITGSVEGSSIAIQLEQNPRSEWDGTVTGDTMDLRSGLAHWEGESATFRDFGDAAEEMAEASQHGNYQD